MKLHAHEGLDVSRQEHLHEHLVQYFNSLQENAKRLHRMSSERLEELEKARLLINGGTVYDVSDESSLLNSQRTGGQAVQLSRDIKDSLEYQQSRL